MVPEQHCPLLGGRTASICWITKTTHLTSSRTSVAYIVWTMLQVLQTLVTCVADCLRGRSGEEAHVLVPPQVWHVKCWAQGNQWQAELKAQQSARGRSELKFFHPLRDFRNFGGLCDGIGGFSSSPRVQVKHSYKMRGLLLVDVYWGIDVRFCNIAPRLP